jgi:hypothetical protein
VAENHHALVKLGQWPITCENPSLGFSIVYGLASGLHHSKHGGLKKMKKILAGLILASGTLLAGPHISVGIGLGVPVAPAPVVGVAPGPGYFWTPGYFYFAGGHRLWHAGFWAPRGFRR